MWCDCAFFVAFSDEKRRRDFQRCEEQYEKQHGLTIELSRALIVSPHRHESNLHGFYNRTRNGLLGQLIFTQQDALGLSLNYREV